MTMSASVFPACERNAQAHQSVPQSARQAALSKALSTAYLSHQISELQSRVEATHLPHGREGHGRPDHSMHEHAGQRRGRGGAGRDGGRGQRRGAHAPEGLHVHHAISPEDGGVDDTPRPEDRRDGVARIDDSDPEDPFRDDEMDSRSKEWRAVVVDVSALMWAPKSVRRLLGIGWEVVVPLEGVSCLSSTAPLTTARELG